MSLTQNVFYPVIIVILIFCSVVLAVTVKEGLAEFSDEDASETFIGANNKGITALNKTTMEHFTGLQQLYLGVNEFKEFPDLTVVSDTLEQLYLYGTHSLSKAGNVHLAVLKRLWLISIHNTNLTFLTSTCPEDSEQEYVAWSDSLDLCDCQHVWLKVSYDENNKNITVIIIIRLWSQYGHLELIT